MDAKAPDDVPVGLLLHVWEQVSVERSMQRVLEAIAEALLPAVRFDGVGVFASEQQPPRGWAYVVGHRSSEGESLSEYLGRPEFAERLELPDRPARSYDTWTEFHRPHTCSDLLALDTWLEHEREMARAQVRAYAWIPMVAQGRTLGGALFNRTEPEPFTPAQMATLVASSRALAVAVANAIANDDLRALREALEAENLDLKAQLGQAPWRADLVGDSVAMRHLLSLVEQVAPTPATVLLTGETGTGKEVVARAIHRRSPRAAAPLVTINCAAIPEGLLAAELFGHERGAFTGASERRRGRFEQADGGTLLLDEVGELPPAMQVTLLRVLQEREIERLGGQRPVKVDVRIIAATHRDLAADVAAGRFRRDLFYRLNAFPVHVPALRDRLDDLPALVAHLVARLASRHGKRIDRLSPRALTRLSEHTWPGNVRELENVLERAVILARGHTLHLDALPRSPLPEPGDLAEDLSARERQAIEQALAASRGRVSGAQGAARRLGMPASTLEFRIRRLGIDKLRYRPRP